MDCDEIEKRLIALLRDPYKFSMYQLQKYWQDFSTGDDLTWDEIWAKATQNGRPQCGMAEALVKMCIRHRTLEALIVQMRRTNSTAMNEIDLDAPKTYSANETTAQFNGLLIVTATKIEAKMVLEVFSQVTDKAWSRTPIRNKIYYNLGIHGGVSVSMVQSEMGTATPGGSLLTVHQAIQDLQPRAAIMCGIAFGLRPDKQQLGDILVARQLLCYEPQKIDIKRGQLPRGDRVAASEHLLNRFRSGDIDWQGPKAHFGLVLSGEKLVNDPTFRDWLLKNEPEAVGGEMEGNGLYVAARDAKVDWILVKAICDWGDGTKNDDAQSLASHNAAQFVLHVLQIGSWEN